MAKILTIDTSASSLSVAICEDGIICGQFCLDTGRTHSEVLLPMTDALLKLSGSRLGDIAAFGVTIGPGSFTGLRIGLATVKGWSMAMDLPVLAISSTEALARGAAGAADIYSCPLFDARREQVYTALFRGEGRLWPDDAVEPELLAFRLRELKAPVLFSGDALSKYSQLFRGILKEHYREAPGDRRLFLAPAAALLAHEKFLRGDFADIAALEPLYLRGAEIDQHQPRRA